MSQKRLQRNISRLMAVLLCMALVFSVIPAAYAAEGSCGDNLSWTFDGSTLTITGFGVMDNYSEGGAPWNAFRESIINISLPDGLTRIGSWAFADCSKLLSVSIPGSVELIDEHAFRRCTSMTMLTLNEGLRTIGVCAFEQCRKLADLRLPNSLINLNDHAFYMCEGLTYVTIPGTISSIGSGVFCYCSGLVRVDVNTSTQMPSWSFYGCDKLEIITVQGSSVDPESLKIVTPPQGIDGDSAGDSGQEMEPPTPGETEQTEPAPEAGLATSESVTTNFAGEQLVDKIIATQSGNSTTVSVSTALAGQQGTTTTITSTIQNDQGWVDVIEKVNSATIGGNSMPVDVTVYVPNSDIIASNVLQQFAGKNVLLNIQTHAGGRVTIDCNQLETVDLDDFALSYTLVPAEVIPEELEGCTVYQLKFYASAQLPTELVIRLPGGHALSTATLYQMQGRNKLEKLQSVLVDGDGDSHWFVSAVDEKTDYLIGIDVPNAAEDTPIIPPELHDVYKIENVYDGVEYVVTGRTSSWGMNLGQVMGILAAVMVTVIVIVGAVVYLWNKKRLKSGFVPGLDDEEE